MILRLIILVIFPFSILNAQTKKIEVNTGMEYRITPFNFKDSQKYSQEIIYNRDQQLSGLSLVVGLDYEIFRNVKIGLSESVRHDEKYYSNSENKTIKGMIYDTQFQIKYLFKIKNLDLNVFAGYAFMNNNTSYTEIKVFQSDVNGNPTSYAYGDNDFSFDSYKFGIGYNYKKFNFILGMYITEREHNFSSFGTSAIGMPFLQLNYNVFKF